MPIPSHLRFDAGTPPSEWLDPSTNIAVTAVALHLWEMTVSLIHNEEALSEDQDRYLAMVYEHWVSARDAH